MSIEEATGTWKVDRMEGPLRTEGTSPEREAAEELRLLILGVELTGAVGLGVKLERAEEIEGVAAGKAATDKTAAGGDSKKERRLPWDKTEPSSTQSLGKEISKEGGEAMESTVLTRGTERREATDRELLRDGRGVLSTGTVLEGAV